MPDRGPAVGASRNGGADGGGGGGEEGEEEEEEMEESFLQRGGENEFWLEAESWERTGEGRPAGEGELLP